MSAPSPPSHFPTAEGIGVFVGVAAWDLLAAGRLDVGKALLVALGCSLVWYAIRRWRARRPAPPGAAEMKDAP